MKTDSRLDLILLAAVAAVFMLLGLVILPLPFLRDQGIYSYIAWCWSEGLVPYKDAFGHKGPLLYLVYMVSLGISKGAMWGPNLADLVSRTLTVILMYLCARTFFDRKTGILAAFFTALPLIAIFNSCWWNAQAETFMMPLMVLSLLLVGISRGRHGGVAVALSGMVAAQAVMLKSTAVWHALFVLTLIRPATERGHRNPALFIIGLFVGILPWLIYFSAKGAMPHLYEALVIFNIFHAGPPRGTMITELLGTGASGLWTVSGLFLIPAVVPVVLWLSRKSGQLDRLPLGFFIFSLLQVAFQMKFFLYHWLVIIPALGLLTARGLTMMMSTGSGEKRRAAYRIISIGLVVLQAILFFRFYFLILDHYQTLPYLRGKMDRLQYYSRFQEELKHGLSDVNFHATWLVAHELRHNTKPDDRVLVFGYEPAVYYLAARRAPTRFHSDYPLTFPAESSREKSSRQKWRGEFLDDIKSDLPARVILVRNDINVLEAEDSYTQAKEFIEFWSWLNENYQSERSVEDFEIFVRK